MHLDHAQAVALRRIAAGLDRAGAVLRSGKRVVNGPDAVRWLLENVTETPSE